MDVGLFGLQTSTSRVAIVICSSMAPRSWRWSASTVDRDRACPGRRREVRVDAEARPCVDELGAGLEQRLARGEQDVARPVADRDPVHRHAVAVAQGRAQRRARRIGVAVEAGERRADGVDHGGDRRVRRLVGGEQRDVAFQRVAGGGGVDGDPADPLGELDRHDGAEVTARRAGPGGARRSRRGTRGPGRGGRRRRRGSSRGSRSASSRARRSPARTSAARG